MKATPVWTNSLATQSLTDFSKKQVTEILKFLVLQMRLTCWQYRKPRNTKETQQKETQEKQTKEHN